MAMAAARRRQGRIVKALLGLAVLAVLGAYAFSRVRGASEPEFRYVTAPIRRGDLREVVTATGTLKGRDSVDVGAQISGRVSNVLVQVNDVVKKGDVLAEIDPEQLRSRVEQSRAQVRAGDAAVQQARATQAQSATVLVRIRDLESKGLASKQQLEVAEGDAQRAAATLASAEAQATLARASLRDAETSLSWASIRAPMDGIVLARMVEPGQTVAASLQSPVLFTLARDLSQLELRVEIDEADVGRVQRDQRATFTVDAWPNEVFESRVLNVHNLPTPEQTVVTYQAVLSVDNDHLRLKPGMTATANVVTSEKKQVLLVPNAALRFRPPAPRAESGASGPGLPFMGMPRGRPWANARGRAPDKAGAAMQETVWKLQGDTPVPIVIEVGGTDGEFTELVKTVGPRRRSGEAEAGVGAPSRAGGGKPSEPGAARPVAAGVSDREPTRPAQGAGADGAAPPAPVELGEGSLLVVDVDDQKPGR